MATLNLPAQTIDTADKVDSMRLVLSLLKSDDDGNHGGTAGNLWIVDGPTALPIARAFIREYGQEVGFDPDLDPATATPKQLAAAMFRKFRQLIADAYHRDQLIPVNQNHSDAVVAERAQSETELDAAIGADEDIS